MMERLTPERRRSPSSCTTCSRCASTALAATLSVTPAAARQLASQAGGRCRTRRAPPSHRSGRTAPDGASILAAARSGDLDGSARCARAGRGVRRRRWRHRPGGPRRPSKAPCPPPDSCSKRDMGRGREAPSTTSSRCWSTASLGLLVEAKNWRSTASPCRARRPRRTCAWSCRSPCGIGGLPRSRISSIRTNSRMCQTSQLSGHSSAGVT